jgi:hypothetical protein
MKMNKIVQKQKIHKTNKLIKMMRQMISKIGNKMEKMYIMGK